jgi:2-methylcitrate dehydratase PrpD
MLSLKPNKGNCTILGDGEKVSLRDAAIINSFMAHSSYFEDGSRLTGGHPSSSILPAVIALGEERGYGGKEMIAAMVVGYEIFNRIGGVMYPSAVHRGFQPTSLLAPLAAAAACAKMMNLDAEKTSQALNIAAPLGAGLKSAFKEAETQPLQVGRGCEAGLVAALLAEEGLKGADRNIESFISSHDGHIDKLIPIDDWGKEFEIKNTYIKIHAGCRGNHAPLDAVLSLIEKHKIRINEIKSIKVTIDTVTAANEIHNPKNKNEAQFNIPFSIAVALKNGNASLFQFTDENLNDNAIIAIMDKVSILVDPEWTIYADKRAPKGEIELN